MSAFPGATSYPVRWWGFPNVGSPRRIKPTILLVVHITGNSAMPNALSEATYSNRDGSGASFSFVTNRDGSIVQCLDPSQVPWTNGLVNQPNLALPTVKGLASSSYNANEYCLATCENVGYEPGNPLTAAQVATLGRLVKWLSDLSGLPVNRLTVIGHRDIDSVTRHNCPTSGDLEALLARIIAAAVGASAPAPGGDVTQGHPATYISKSGRVQLATNRAYNAFQYLGLNADGTPNLKRYTSLRYTASTNASVIARAHWEVNKAEADCFLVTPWAYLPGAGWTEMLWWSKSPLPEPDYTDTAGTDCSAAVATATAPLQAKLDAARKALA